MPRVVDGIKCVIVSEALRDIEPMAWDFVMNFARDSELGLTEVTPPATPVIEPAPRAGRSGMVRHQ